jgi:hypothetical protein
MNIKTRAMTLRCKALNFMDYFGRLTSPSASTLSTSMGAILMDANNRVMRIIKMVIAISYCAG